MDKRNHFLRFIFKCRARHKQHALCTFTDFLHIDVYKRQGVLSGAFFKGLRFPVVLIGNPVDRFAADTLLPDTFEGSYRAVRHLIKNGHERIAYLCESEVCGTQRFEGYRKALEDSGIASEKVLVRAGLKTEALAAEAMAVSYTHLYDGFSGGDAETYIRWTQWAAFCPLMRYHGTFPKEPWEYSEQVTEPVSYTHLDVYKRQQERFAILSGFFPGSFRLSSVPCRWYILHSFGVNPV